MVHSALIVQNEPFLTEMKGKLTQRLGSLYRFDGAHTAKDALKSLQTNRYEMVVTGMDIPGIDGKQFLARVMDLQPDCPRRCNAPWMTSGSQLGATMRRPPAA